MKYKDFGYTLHQVTGTLRPAALQLTRNRDDSNDLLQETLLKAFRNRHRFNPGTNLKAWVYTIMKNTFISDYQKKVRRKTFTDPTDNQYFLNSASNLPSHREADSELRLSEIHHAINQLTPQYRIPFEMYFTGFKYQEIAEKLSLPLGTVKNRIFLARKELKSKLKNFI